MGPDIAASAVHGASITGTSIIFDAKMPSLVHFADFVRAQHHIVLADGGCTASKFCRCDGNHRARAAFAEKRRHSSGIVGTPALSSAPRPWRCEAGFGESDGQAAIADVVGGLNGFASLASATRQSIRRFSAARSIAGGCAGDDACDRLRIFRGRKFAGKFGRLGACGACATDRSSIHRATRSCRLRCGTPSSKHCAASSKMPRMPMTGVG